jgi:hypothetical protein
MTQKLSEFKLESRTPMSLLRATREATAWPGRGFPAAGRWAPGSQCCSSPFHFSPSPLFSLSFSLVLGCAWRPWRGWIRLLLVGSPPPQPPSLPQRPVLRALGDALVGRSAHLVPDLPRLGAGLTLGGLRTDLAVLSAEASVRSS